MSTEKQNQWDYLVETLKLAFQDGQQEDILALLLTPDEREAFAVRLQIVKELLMGNLNQRDLKTQLGTGIATITRGSNSLKAASPEFRQWLVNHLTES